MLANLTLHSFSSLLLFCLFLFLMLALVRLLSFCLLAMTLLT